MSKITVILKRLIKAVAGLILCLVVGIAAFIFWGTVGIFSYQKFDEEAWLRKPTNETDSTCYRGGMATYVRKFVLSENMSREAVLRLLGDPDKSEKEKIEYTLGMCSGLGIDYDGLVIKFSQDGKLTEALVVQH